MENDLGYIVAYVILLMNIGICDLVIFRLVWLLQEF